MPDRLIVWQSRMPVAEIEQDRGRRLRLTYTREALDAYPLGTPLLSLRLPLTDQRYSQGAVKPFLEGLLPEGIARLTIAAARNVVASDTFALIREIGRDCAGALVILPEGAAPLRPASVNEARPLGDADLEGLVRNLRSAPLGVGAGARISLAGVQEKLVLTRLAGGRWALPDEGLPSTHILKPEVAEYPNTVENEAFCMRFAKHLGLGAANVETAMIGGRKLIVVERYDRQRRDDGTIERIHQEDFCQALGILPENKYQESGGPSLLKLARILDGVAGPPALQDLLRAVALNVLVGNADAHGKNFSLLHHPVGTVALAPLYDVMSTLIYRDTHLAMRIGGVERPDRVTGARIVSEAAAWGMPTARAVEIVAGLLDRAPVAAEVAAGETSGVPPSIRVALDQRLTGMRASLA